MNETLSLKSCAWALTSQQYLDYHDKEWGMPVHDDRKLFEMLTLEGVQAGLSWSLILKKRAGYLQAFDSFDAHKMALYADQKVQELRESDAMSKELKRHSFTFVVTTICYALMQAVGMANDHIVECFRWQEVQFPAR